MSDIYRRTIRERAVDGRRLGRHVAHDPRSRNYPAETIAPVHDVAHRAAGLPLNQLDVGKCTSEALAGALNSAPDYKGGALLNDDDTDRIYEVETEREGAPWSPTEPGVNDIGGSGLEVCRAAKSMGLLRLYRHAFGLEHALRALVLRPNIWGINWYSGLDDPDPKTGVAKVTGRIRGGHEIVALRIITADELVGFAQSWGDWGVPDLEVGLRTGAFYISFADLDRLLSEDGDVTVPYP